MPGNICAVYGCYNSSHKLKDSNIRFYSFPKDKSLARKWQLACRRSDKMNIKTSRICSEHFDTSVMVDSPQRQLLQYAPKNNRNLSRDAVPTENLPSSNQKVQETSKGMDIQARKKICEDLVKISPGCSSEISSKPLEDVHIQPQPDLVLEENGGELIQSTHEVIQDRIILLEEENINHKTENLQAMEIGSESLVIKQEIKEEDEVSFELISEESHPIETVKVESLLNETEQEDNCLDMVGQSCFVVDGIKEESVLSKEDLDNTEFDKNLEFKEEEIDCDWLEPPLNEPDPLALPEMQDTNEAKAAESLSNSTTNDSSILTQNNNDVKKYKKDYSKHTNNLQEKRYKCSACDYSCKRAHCLKRHIMTHTGEKPYKCYECNYSCVQLNHLKNHKRIHTGEKPFKCKECDYACYQGTLLKRHMLKHTGEKPFKCKECDYFSIQSNILKRHMMTHTGEKPFKCEECDYACSRSHSLKIHMITHRKVQSLKTPYKCQECGYYAATEIKVKKHTNTVHSSVKPFMCKDCNYSTSVAVNLIKHSRIHAKWKL